MSICVSPTTIFADAVAYTEGELLEESYYAQVQLIEEEITESMQRQSDLIAIYNEVEESMKLPQAQTQAQRVPPPRTKTMYAPYYGGAYVEDGSTLVICVTSEDVIPLDVEDNVSYKVVENSYNDLAAILTSVGEQYEEYYPLYDGTGSNEELLLKSLAGIGIDETLNNMNVEIVDVTDEKIIGFYELFGENDVFVFKNVGGFKNEIATYKPGVALYVITGQSGTTITYVRLSMGYRAYDDFNGVYSYGFTTAGHGVQDSIGHAIYSNSSFTNQIGTRSVWAFNGSVDASFILNGTNTTIGTQANYSDSSGSTSGGDNIATNTYMLSIGTGEVVYKVGSTTYKTSATVLDTDFSATVSGVCFTNLTKTTYFATQGDSGGLVYTYYNGAYRPAGIISAEQKTSLPYYNMYVKASAVVDHMLVYPY
jgi:hypothetical protein